jgi:glycosyltransferase involved in cell wall biosynthesis
VNIVYVTDSDVNPTSGGIARTTYVMMEALRKQGHSVYAVHKREEFLSFVAPLGKCVVIVQNPCTWAKEVFDAKEALPQVKIINVFHGTPGFEIVPLKWDIIRYHLCHNIERRWTLKQSLLQMGMTFFPKKCFARMLRRKYAQPYGKADKMVVLSPGIIDQYQYFAPGHKYCFTAIPNALSFDNVTLPKIKEKEVLVVGRLDDWHKRISEILSIWEIVQKDERYHDWTLSIVGEGIDKPFYEDFVQQRKIPNIRFEGHQNPLPYYQRASLFVMTSACEGLPMTILEAQQCGCVPIVYDSFASAKDVITNGENGNLIVNQDREAFVVALKRLMTDDELRKQMSEACVKSSERFSVENVAAQWNELLQSL